MRPYDERLDHFLSRAAKVFADQGYHSTTMRDLAAATDMSLAGMYYYVRGKEELLFRIQERCFMRVLAGAQRALAALEGGDADPGERLHAFIRHHVTFFAAHMAEMKVLSHEAEVLKNGFGAEIAAIKREYYRICIELLDNYKRATGLEFSSRTAVLSLFGMMNWIYTWYNPRVDADARQLAREMGDIFLRGVGAASGNGKKRKSAPSN